MLPLLFYAGILFYHPYTLSVTDILAFKNSVNIFSPITFIIHNVCGQIVLGQPEAEGVVFRGHMISCLMYADEAARMRISTFEIIVLRQKNSPCHLRVG